MSRDGNWLEWISFLLRPCLTSRKFLSHMQLIAYCELDFLLWKTGQSRLNQRQDHFGARITFQVVSDNCLLLDLLQAGNRYWMDWINCVWVADSGHTLAKVHAFNCLYESPILQAEFTPITNVGSHTQTLLYEQQLIAVIMLHESNSWML